MLYFHFFLDHGLVREKIQQDERCNRLRVGTNGYRRVPCNPDGEILTLATGN